MQHPWWEVSRPAASAYEKETTMNRAALSFCLLLACLGLASPAAGADSGVLYGTVVTTDGRTLTGELRWDHNENYWDDVLDATKEEAVVVQEDEEDNSFSFLGLRLPSWGDNERHILHSFSIPFGHLRSIEKEEKGWAVVTLKDGGTFRVRTTGDLGSGMRGIELIRPDQEPNSLEWSDLEKVEFSPAPAAPAASASQRLYGTVETRSGSFTGFVVWDRDEALLVDTVDGESAGKDHEIPFADIRFIARDGHRSSTLGLQDGSEIELSGTNDVNDDNRGILILVSGLGNVSVEWDEFIRFDRAAAPASTPYSAFDGGYRLHGRMTAADGTVHDGTITWDKDERFSWETLDGRADDIEYAIPFANITSIENSSSRGAVVHLTNGKTLELRGSNDVNEENQGIAVESSDGRLIEVDWDDFQAIELRRPADG
jgi:hypothetical protein